MKAYFCTKYGPPEVLQIREVEKPSPKDNEILIRIRATAVTASDIFIRSSQIPLRLKIPMRIMIGISKPRRGITGLVLSGEVESAGKEITRFKAGDKVFGMSGFGLGCYAEYICLKERDSIRGCVAHKPETITHEEATAAAYGGLLALQFMERGKINSDSNVLIYGASGTSGVFAVQYAKSCGADVTAICGTSNLEFIKSLGADKVIDYTKTDIFDPDAKFDFILDAVGKQKSSKLKRSCKKALKIGGLYRSIDDGNMLLDSGRLKQIQQLIDSGAVKIHLDKIYPFEELVEAHRYVQTGHKRGGVAITI